MATGNPLLVVWYPDGTLRLYELISGVFVQQAATGGLTHTPATHPDGRTFLPALDFIRDGEFVELRRSPNANTTRGVTLDRDLTQTGTFDQTITGEAVGPAGYNHSENVSSLYASVAGLVADMFIGTSGNMGLAQADSSWIEDDDVTGIWFSPSAEFVLIGSVLSSKVITKRRTGIAAAVYAVYDAGSAIDGLPFSVDVAAWTPNNQCVIVGNAAGKVGVCRLDSTTFEFLYELVHEPGFPVAIAVSPDGATVAIASDDSGTITTVIYSRQGPMLFKRQTLAGGFGSALSFTQDSTILVDALNKVAYHLVSGTWTTLSGAMTNVVSGAAIQSVSPHTVNPVGFSQFYDNRLADYMEGNLDINDLKLTLIEPGGPTFSPAHTTLSAAVGAFEVSAGLWPAGGHAIENVSLAPDGLQGYQISCDPIEHIFAGDPVAFDAAVIYEVGTDKPLIYVDFLSGFDLPANRKITITFDSNGLIYFGTE